MKDIYPIPQYILDAYNSCTINWEAKQLKFPRRQFADALAKSSYTKETEAWFNQVAEETGLKINANEIFQICIRHHLTEYKPAKCPTCGKLLSLSSVKIGVQFCSNRCAQLDPNISVKREQTCLKNHGVSNPNLSKDIIEKRMKTNRERYGGNAPICSSKVKEKIIQTTIDKYGVSNAFQAETVKDKIKETLIDTYGSTHPMKVESIKEKVKSTNQLRYGGNAPICSSEIKEKIQNTLYDHYGVTVPAKSEHIKDKIKDTMIERYGVDVPLKSKFIKQKYVNTNQERYGANTPLQSKYIRNKIITTRKINYFPKFLQLLEEKSIEYTSSKEEYVNRGLLSFKCKLCGTSWYRSVDEEPTQGVHNISCPKCSSEHFVSKAEKSVLHFIKSIYSSSIIENDREIIKPKELDIYIPEKKLAIEFNGSFWHQNKPPKYHFYKTYLCRKQGIRLIHIFEHEWAFNQEKVKNLIKSALGIFEKKCYARQCMLQEISYEEYREFLDLYHLQGSVKSSIRYGLFFKNELVSVIGFGKSRFKKGEIELHRYCVKAGYQVIGGFSKLIKHACKEHQIKEFISYIDLAHFSGRGYKKIGFTKVELTQPNYVYVRGEEVKSRIACQKHKLETFLEEYNSELSESDNMKNNGWLKVYDCGNLKVKYSIS